MSENILLVTDHHEDQDILKLITYLRNFRFCYKKQSRWKADEFDRFSDAENEFESCRICTFSKMSSS